ncbi:MAG: hypothetical protein H6737_32205 [Alphaproteobacteria bacterium]|nr:hypothetical protein [Alphaproteobacteria bacterium]
MELTTRADQADLPARIQLMAVVLPGKPVELLNTEAEIDTWRIVEVFSRTGLPFEADLSWSSGTGSGAGAQVTVSRSARICVLARSLRISATNLAKKLNRVGVTVADGFAPTRNTWEVPTGVAEGTPLEVDVPPFAETFRLELAEPGAYAATQIAVKDALGDTRGAYNAAFQPHSGIPVGGASKIAATTTHPGTLARVVFHLSL